MALKPVLWIHLFVLFGLVNVFFDELDQLYEHPTLSIEQCAKFNTILRNKFTFFNGLFFLYTLVTHANEYTLYKNAKRFKWHEQRYILACRAAYQTRQATTRHHTHTTYNIISKSGYFCMLTCALDLILYANSPVSIRLSLTDSICWVVLLSLPHFRQIVN